MMSTNPQAPSWDPLHHRTPLVRDEPLSAQLERPVWRKLETRQPSGSFKIRGIGRLAQAHVREGAEGLLSSSGGNAGRATAYAGRSLGRPVTVVVPESTPSSKAAAVRAEGAEVIRHGVDWQAAHTRAEALSQARGWPLIHPFDHPALWAGHATMVDEWEAEGCAPSDVVVAVGGGGLLRGVLAGLEHHSRLPETRVHAVETRGAASLAAALEAGRPVALAEITSRATSLGARQVAAEAFAAARRHGVRPWILEDEDAERATEQHRSATGEGVDLACGATLALPGLQPETFRGLRGALLLVVCG